MPSAPAASRQRTQLRDGWRFAESDTLEGAEAPAFDDSAWRPVTVPHTWGRKPLRRAWYRTRFRLEPEDRGRRVYLDFEGAATFADVYVNGGRLGRHRGAFTRFVFDATPHARPGDNLLAVRLTNAPQDTAESLPSGASKQLYHLYGGLYRKVWLLRTDAVHVDPADLGASGVSLSATNVSADAADLKLRIRVRNAGAERHRIEVRGRLDDAASREVARLRGTVELDAGAAGETSLAGRLSSPQLWSPSQPYLYRLTAELLLDGRVRDAVTIRTGFRDVEWRDGRLFLNGTALLLRGIGKHQETEHRLSAVGDDELREDFANLKDLGVNLVRLAHYPHAELEYDLADELGILVWAENGHSNPYKHRTDVGDVITREMVRQNLNHPSIVMWSVGNEAAFLRVNRYAGVAREEDPTRLVTYASNTGSRGKQRFPNLDFVAQNTYRGWYRGEPWEFEQKALELAYVAESGGGAVVTHHTDYAAAHRVVDRFEPEEYRQLLAEVHFQNVFRRHPERIPLYLVWVLRDFGIEKYKGVWNTKGLLTYSNLRKDAYYLYKAFLRPEAPVVHITSKTYFLRRGSPENGVKAYSNRAALALSVNGVDQGTRANGAYRHPNGASIDNVFYWPCRLDAGRNRIVVDDGAGNRDTAIVYYQAQGARAGVEAATDAVRELRSSNPASPAVFIDQPIREQWPFYAEFDGSADNSFDRLPPLLEGARWIATPRLSKREKRSDLSFRLAADADVFVMATAERPQPPGLASAGFEDAGERGLWRDDALRLVAWRLHRKQARAGAQLRVQSAANDYVVLVKPR